MQNEEEDNDKAENEDAFDEDAFNESAYDLIRKLNPLQVIGLFSFIDDIQNIGQHQRHSDYQVEEAQEAEQVQEQDDREETCLHVNQEMKHVSIIPIVIWNFRCNLKLINKSCVNIIISFNFV